MGGVLKDGDSSTSTEGWRQTVLLYNTYIHTHVHDTSHTIHIYMYMYMYMIPQSTILGKASTCMPEDNSLFLKRKNELPQAGFESAMFCVLGRCSTN